MWDQIIGAFITSGILNYFYDKWKLSFYSTPKVGRYIALTDGDPDSVQAYKITEILDDGNYLRVEDGFLVARTSAFYPYPENGTLLFRRFE